MNILIRTLLFGFLSFALIAGCKSEEPKEPETDSIDTQMRQVGHDAADSIKAKLQKAEDAGQSQTDHYKNLDQQIDSQE